jgi:hypothetical protein
MPSSAEFERWGFVTDPYHRGRRGRTHTLNARHLFGSSAEPNQVGTAGDVSGTGRAPLGFGPRKFRRSDATSLPSGSTWPCSLDRATVWPSACSRRRVSEIRQRGASCVLAERPIELLQEMRLDGLRSRRRFATRKIVDRVPRQELFMCTDPPFGGVDINPVTHRD